MAITLLRVSGREREARMHEVRRPREGGDPASLRESHWVPAFAGTTRNYAGIEQLLSSFVGAISSRLWLAPGTGADVVNRSHLSLTSAAGLKRSVYISCISWWSQPR